ncbi:hypothetical protein V2G26_013063 [Clonostachys chloroleuca]
MGSKRLDYAIIGGGISGLSLAIALHHRGVSVHIYERARKFGEIGAGVSFTSNALQSMKICHPGIHDAFEKVSTRNVWPSKQSVWFDYYNGQQASSEKPAFSITNDLGQRGVHRAHFLDELVKMIPSDISSFGKELERYERGNDGVYTLFFGDGSTARADAIIACDGIKSRVRQLMFGIDHKCAFPSYTHKYAYRALIPMADAAAAIGSEKAENACMHMGKGGHVLTFPVNQGQTLNIVAFHTTEKEWPDRVRLTAPATREDALRDFADFGNTVTDLLRLSPRELDTWAIFDLGDNPPPTFAKDGVCLVGDAAHATSPHHGAGAGLCIEDAAVLAELLSDRRVATRRDAEHAFATFDAVRRERGSWLVQSSRHIGNAYEWLVPGLEDNLDRIEADINHRNGIIANVDVASMCSQAVAELASGYDIIAGAKI